MQSVLEVPPALAQPAAALIGAALTGLTAIARQSADRLLEPPLGLLARAFVRSWLPLLAISASSIKCSREAGPRLSTPNGSSRATAERVS